ncbi:MULTISPECIES: phage major capsid protein [Caproicibacterium]|uniref:Phage major capsid protein n=1 Tax=Caproicibacterium argilliputei TaxID=3030016 RepID=A0AA97DAR1_9FIRM|nr:phage major capsid protein [Caproicibacterium argilliputei]WOC32153.1 phage major capsid protein [Caproicibacterium argilliputei]
MAFYENLHLEKGMYGTGKSFSAVLESLDRSENYRGTPLEELDAYQRQLKRFDIHVNGRGSDRVEKFFQTGESAALFPEYVCRAVRQGMEQENLLPSLVATTTQVEGMDYRTITSTPLEAEKELKLVAEGTAVPQTVVRTQDHLVHLHKRGRMLVASYEALRFQRLDLFTVTLRQIGAYIARMQMGDAVQVLLHGDDGKDQAEELTAEKGVTYAGLLQLWGKLTPYRMNGLLGGTAAVQQVLGLAEMRDAQAGLNFQGTGRLVAPMGAQLLHVPDVPDGKLIGIDRTCALEMVQAGDVQTEYDKLIDRQLERATISTIAGFTKIFNGAVKVLNCAA